jgi:hypothetical protein
MPFLLLYIGKGRKFQRPAVTNALQALSGAKPLRPCDDCLSTYQYVTGRDSTIIRFKSDQETIVIDGSGDASLFAALHIQSEYPDEIHVIDDGYTFDLVLRDIASLDELKRRIRDAGG